MYRKAKYSFFTTNEIKPSGWLKKQLQIQAEGLCGNLDKVWPDVKDSAWIGGKREGWERLPYWLDGFIPMAFLLDDEDMKQRAKTYIDAILSFQKEDGWICPCSDSDRENYDTWAVLLITKVLCLWADCSGDERVEGAVEKCLLQFSKHLNKYTLRNWGAARWFEALIPISWLYERTHDERLLVLAKKLRIQGFDWKGIFDNYLLDGCTEGWDYYSHIVNIAMMLKSEALWSLFEDIEPEALADEALEYLDKKHGTVTGHFNGDENLSGNSPVQGAELCSIVELMYSYEWLFAVTGNTKYLDRLELLAYNSLPAAVSPDMWSHQYVQMINQVAAYPMAKQPFRTNNNVAHTFGLEPHFGCCTANFGQGFPKFAVSAFMKEDKKIISCIPVSSKLTTNIGASNVVCEVVGDYPFKGSIKYKISVSSDAEFTFSIRIPCFAETAKLDGKAVSCGEIIDINRIWSGETEICLELDFKAELVERPENMFCLIRGPIVYALPIAEKWERVEYESNGVERKYPYCDYYIYPQDKWNYAFANDKLEVNEHDFDCAFFNENPPVSIAVNICEVEWDMENGHCTSVPSSRKMIGKAKKAEFIPYGCTNLRITEIPFAN